MFAKRLRLNRTYNGLRDGPGIVGIGRQTTTVPFGEPMTPTSGELKSLYYDDKAYWNHSPKIDVPITLSGSGVKP